MKFSQNDIASRDNKITVRVIEMIEPEAYRIEVLSMKRPVGSCVVGETRITNAEAFDASFVLVES